MGNRKLPFGYQMRMGEIVRNEPEAKAVQDIFLQYTLGVRRKPVDFPPCCRWSKIDIGGSLPGFYTGFYAAGIFASSRFILGYFDFSQLIGDGGGHLFRSAGAAEIHGCDIHGAMPG